MKTAMQQQQQKPKQLTLFQAGFKKDEISRWGVPIGPGPSHSAPPPPQPGPSCSVAVPPAPGLPPQASDQQGSDVILIDDDDDDLLLAQALDQTMSEYLDTAPPPAAAAGTPLEVLPGFDADAGTTWVYPVNYPVRQYQYNIVHTAIFENTLVSLPTGLGKTFIAAVLMYNFYRWYPRGKVVFLAPTRPLVAQQIDACYRIMGISREDTAELTGSMAPSDRRSRWLDRRVFFLTPQVLNNDLTTGSCPAELLRCVVIDEAHKALGNHAYCQVVKELSRHTTQFRVLALSATPGSDLKAVIQVLTNLLISRVEVRSEESPDVTPYTHGRQLEKIVVPLGDGLKAVRDKYMQVVRTFVSRLIQLKVVYTRDETTLTKFALLRARDAFKQSPPPGLAHHQQSLVESDFAMCMSLYHALELLQLHGVRSFHTFIQSIVRGEKGSARGRAELVRNPVFNELLNELEQKFGLRPDDGSTVGTDGEQVAAPAALEQSHPKLARLRELVEQHFRDCGDTTRVMVFSQYRESVLEISAVLQQLHPTVRAMHFIGQSAGKSSRGFSQKEQLKVIAAFRTGGFNTLVSTCVGEEGLDIGDVDLIVCYDVSKSPISLVQRMGRTGRKRQGRIVVLVTEGKEDHVYNQSMYQRKSMLKTIMTGTKLGPHLFKNSPRMIPRGLQPVCHRLHMTVAASSPAAATGRGRARGRSRGGPVAGRGRGRGRGAGRGTGGGQMASLLAALAPERGPATAAYLSDDEMREWDTRYKLRPGDGPARRLPPRHAAGATSTGSGRPSAPALLSLTEWLPWQTTLQPTHAVSHSDVSRNLVRLLAFMAEQAHTGADGYDQEMTALRRHAGVELEPSPPAPAMPPPPAPARPASPPVRPAADLSALSESEQVAEAIRLSLLETSGADSPPPPPPPPPDWPPVAPPPLFTGWGGAAGLLSALEEALAAPLVTVDEGALMMSAERTERLEARCWLEAERHGSERKDLMVERETGDFDEESKFVNEGNGTTGPEIEGRTNTSSDFTKPESALGAAVPSEPPKPAPVCEAGPLEGPSDAPEGGAAEWDDLPDDWNADWEWNPSPLPPATPPPSSPLPPPPSDALGSSVPPRTADVPPSHPPVVSLLSEEDGSPILPSQNPSKRRKLSRGSKRRKIEMPSVEPVPGGALENGGLSTVEPIGTTGWGNAELTEERQTRPSSPPPPPAVTISSPVFRLQAGLTRRPSSDDLFADESLFARVEEPPASAGEPAASLGFEPAPALATPASASVPPSAVAEDGSGTVVERQGALDLQPDRDRLQRESKPADVVAGGRNRLESTDNALKSKTPSRELFSGKQAKNLLPSGKEETHSVKNSEPPPAPTGTARRRHPSSQPLFDFGLDDDALFANVVTPPPAAEPQPPSPDRPPPAAVSVPLASVPPAVSVTVCSPLRSPPLLVRSALSIRDSPAAGTSIYSTTQLLELVDKSVMSPGGRTPSGKGAGRMGERIGTPAGRVRGEREREKDRVAEKLERVRVESERKESGKTGGTTVKLAPAAPAAREVEKPVFDLFADFFEDSDLFEGVTSNPGGAADAADHKELAEAKNATKPADSVEVVDLSDSHDVTVVEQGGTVGLASKPAPLPEALPVTGTPSTNLTSRGPTAATPDSALFTVTRPRPQTPCGDPAAPGGGAVSSPAVSPILSSQRRLREAVDRRHSTPLSARGRRRLSKVKQRHSSTGVTPSGPAGRPAGLVAGLGDEDPWAEDEFDTCRRPAPRVLRMDGTSPRVPISPLAGRHVTWGPETDNRHTADTEANNERAHRDTNGKDATDNTLGQSTSGANQNSRHPVVLLSRISDAVSPLARPASRPKSVVSDQESALIPSKLAANETDSPVVPARTAPNNTESPLIPAASAANVTDSPVARVAGRRRHRPALLRDSEEETPPVGWVTDFGEEGGPGGDRQEARSRQESVVESRSRQESARDSSSESVGRRPAAAAGKKRRRRRRARNPFLDDEADLSTDASAASADDESDEPDSDRYDESMIDDAPEPTQPDVDMRAVYLKSVRSPGRAAPAFRRPALPRPSDSELFSQVPHQDDDYEQDSFCVDSDHVEYVSSASSHGESPAKRQRGRRRRIMAVSSSEGERSPVGRRGTSTTRQSDPSATLRSDANTTNRPPSGSESDADFQLDGTEANPRTVERKRVTKKSSDEKTKTSSSTNGVWLSSKRPAGSILKSSAKAKRRSDPDDPFETPTFGTSKKHTPRNMDRPVFDLGLFDSDDEIPTAAPLSERKENIVPDSAERARQARLERARQKQAEFRERLSMRRTPQTAGSAGGGGVEVAGGGGSAGPSGVQSRPPVPSAGSGRQGAPGRSSEQPAPGPLVIIASSREVSCAPRLLSDLRAVHRARTEVRSLPAEDYIVSRRAAVVRRPAADLQTAPGRRRLVARLQRLCRLYSRCWLLVERDRVKPGTAPPPERRPRAADQLIAQLTRASVTVLHTDSPDQSASVLSRLAAAERQAGWCLPPPPEAPPAPIEDARRRFLEALPAVSVPLAGDIRTEFGTLAQFLQSSPTELERRLAGVTSHGRAVELCQALRWSFSQQ
ncbi:Fanconi anemia group M protein-like [Amphibalanus amphitrite]|uniref:Fanconi anemia group M protein-like n=1 Tax=Amphibalanus amphitrite TaxID=1232801 RepID=UPI001C914C1E|nr:Fanconi anemia group M protein-like [Amphibalanus amphitrite]